MKILLLGKNGMLGSALVSALHDMECMAFDIDELDIANFDQVGQKITDMEPNMVINAAAFTDVDRAETDQKTAFLVNSEAVGNLAKQCKKHEIPLFHFSTDYVFRGDNMDGYEENDEPDGAINTYGRSKASGEELLKQNTDKFYLIRTSWLYGPNGKNFPDTIIKTAQAKPELRVVNDQFGKPTYTKDIARVVRNLALGGQEQHPFGTYHLVNENAVNWYDFAREILKVKEIATPVSPIPTSEYPTPAKRPKYSILKNTKLPHLRPWQDALRDYLKNHHKI